MSDIPQVLRIGKISSINYENGTARVTYEDRDSATTNELPFLCWEYWMPGIGDRVLVGHLSNGTTSAVILGPLWHENRRPIEGGKGIYRKEYAFTQGMAYERYDEDNAALTIRAGGVTITLQGGNVAVAGSMSITGDLTVGGGVRVTGHLEAASVEALGNIKSASADVAGAVTAVSVSASGDVTAGGVSGKSHTHTAPHGETSGPH